jgi:hypothetical protein
MKKFLDFVFYSNLFISLCAVMMSIETFILLGIEVSFSSAFPLIPIIFLSTLFVYNLDLFRINNLSQGKGESERQAWRWRNIKKIKVLNVLLAVLIALLSLFSSLESFLFFAHLAVISVAYYLSFKIGSAKFASLRSIPFLKAFIITYVWTASTVWLPALKNGFMIFHDAEVLKVFAERYLFLFALAIIFDIRDIKSDSKSILTIPGAIGSLGTKLISFSLLVLNIYLVSRHYQDMSILVPLLLSSLLTGLLIYKANAFSGEYYFLGVLDGAMALQFIFIMISLAVSY